MKRLRVFLYVIFIIFVTSGCSNKEKKSTLLDGDKDGTDNNQAYENIDETDDRIEDAKEDIKDGYKDDGKGDNIAEGKDGEDDTTFGDNKESLSSNDNKNNQSQVDNNKVDYSSLSEELALQIVQGDFAKTYELFSFATKASISQDALKEAWDSTIRNLGDYVGIHDTKEEVSNPYHICIITLEYEYSGVKIQFTYNASGKVVGIFFSYTVIEAEAVNNDTIEEIKITLGEGNYAVDGMLTLPKGISNPPVAVLVHGSGGHDMDETIMVNRPFRDIALGLAEQGIATIRYNEHAYQNPETLPQNYDIYDDSLDDAFEAIKYALSCSQVDTGRVYVIGHSLGAMVAPNIAAEHKEIKGIICLAGSPRHFEEMIVEQYTFLFGTKEYSEIPQAEKDAQLSSIIKDVERIKNLKGPGTEVLLGYPVSYWYSLQQLNSSEVAKHLELPILILQGSMDYQITPDKDYTAWQELLKGKDNATFKLYNGLNHLFMASEEIGPSNYSIKGNVDKRVIEDMSIWISQH